MRLTLSLSVLAFLLGAPLANGQPAGDAITVPAQTPEYQPLKASANFKALRYLWKIEPEAAFEPADGQEIYIWAKAGKYKLLLGGGMWEKEFEVTPAGSPPPPPGPAPTPGPAPRPIPVPPPPEPTPPAPTPPQPGAISVAVIEDTEARTKLSAEQVKALVSSDVAGYMAQKNYFFRRVDRDILDPLGAPPVELAGYFKAVADQQVALPALVIKSTKAGESLVAKPLPGDPQSLLELLQQYGGPAPKLAAARALATANMESDTRRIPKGRKLGCLQRTTKYGEGRFRAFESAFRPIPRAQWETRVLSLKDYVTHVFDQDGIGSCCSNATVQSLMIVRAIEGLKPVVLSPGSVYGIVSGGRDVGSSLEDNLRQISEVGAAPAEVIPPNEWNPRRWPSNWKELAKPYRMIEWYDLGGKFDNVVSAVMYGFPCVIGVDWDGGGHSVCVVGVVMDKGRASLLYVNSWGEEFGDSGFGLLTESRCQSLPNYGAWCPRTSIYTSGE